MAYEVIAAIDRGNRLTSPAHWAIAVFAVLGFVYVAGGRPGPDNPVGVQSAITQPPASQAAVAPTVVITPAPPAATPTQLTGLLITSPPDGSTVEEAVLTVTGTGPAGATITQDVSFGTDSHTVVGADGTWSIVVTLEEGANSLIFRVGDDRSTAKTLTLVYEPKPTPTPIVTKQPEARYFGPREPIVKFFESQGFSGTESPLLDGTPRWLGKRSSDSALAEAIGPIDDITAVSLTLGVTADNGEASGTLVAIFLSLYAPGSLDWVVDRLDEIPDGDIDKTKTFGDSEVNIQSLTASGGVLVIISIEHQ